MRWVLVAVSTIYTLGLQYLLMKWVSLLEPPRKKNNTKYTCRRNLGEPVILDYTGLSSRAKT